MEFKINNYEPVSNYSENKGNRLELPDPDQASRHLPQTSTSNASTFIIKDPKFMAFDKKSVVKLSKEGSSSLSLDNFSSANMQKQNMNLLRTFDLKQFLVTKNQ